MLTIPSAAGLPQSLMRRSVQAPDEHHRYRTCKADLAVSTPILLGRALRKSGAFMLVTQAALVLTVRLQQSLMSSSTFYLPVLAETFDPAEHASTLPQFSRTQPYTTLQTCCISKKHSLHSSSRPRNAIHQTSH